MRLIDNKLKDAIYGFAVADALGVPYEFMKRGTFLCTDMVCYGSWKQPAGTYSDDTAMMIATLDSIKINKKIDYLDIMRRFHSWYFQGSYAIGRNVFAIGNTCRGAINRFDLINPFCGIDDEFQNGNGALMRVLPLAFLDTVSDEEIANVSKLTHGHHVSATLCIKYVRIAKALLRDEKVSFPFEYPIISSAFVKDTFNSVMYCLSTTNNYKECVLKAVNLGGDTDTIAALSGALAGIIYGYNSIPKSWIEKLRGKDIIEACLF